MSDPFIIDETQEAILDTVRRFNAEVVIPVAAVITAVPILLYITGDGNLMQGSGTDSAFYGVIIGQG